jgi:hypothetical protein
MTYKALQLASGVVKLVKGSPLISVLDCSLAVIQLVSDDASDFLSHKCAHQLHPVVDPQVSHFKHVPFRTSVKFMHSVHISPS